MLKTCRYSIIVISLSLICTFDAVSQTFFSEFTTPFKRNKSSSSVLPISIGVLTAVYLLNPIAEYTEKKVYAGLTKEFSIGWGKLGEHRTAIEYSMIFGGNIRHYLRFSYKYDFLLAKDIQPSHMLQGTSVFKHNYPISNNFSADHIVSNNNR